MAEQLVTPKKQFSKKIVATAAAFALAPIAGCSAPSQEQITLQGTTRQVFADVLDGVAVNKDPFANNTFTVSMKDVYPYNEPKSDNSREIAALQIYDENEARMRSALNLGEYSESGDELLAQAACDTAAINGVLTGDTLQTAHNQWDYYQQLGGQKELDKEYANNDEAVFAITALNLTCKGPVIKALQSGADVTFAPTKNK